METTRPGRFIESGALTPPIDRTYALVDLPTRASIGPTATLRRRCGEPSGERRIDVHHCGDRVERDRGLLRRAGSPLPGHTGAVVDPAA
jgi:hypothetical protein